MRWFFVDFDGVRSLPVLSAGQLSRPIGKMDTTAIENWFALAALAISDGHKFSNEGKIDMSCLDAADARELEAYNLFSIDPVDWKRYKMILSRSGDTPDGIPKLMRSHILRCALPLPMDLDSRLVLEHFMRMAAQAA